MFFLNYLDYSNGDNICAQINRPTVSFVSINNTWSELLKKQELATNLYVVGEYNSTAIAVYDTFSQQYGYILINDPFADITIIVCKSLFEFNQFARTENSADGRLYFN